MNIGREPDVFLGLQAPCGPLYSGVCIISTSVFHHIDTLPVAYFIVLSWVVSASVLARLGGGWLVRMTSGPIRDILAIRVNVSLSGDEIVFHLFEKQTWLNLQAHVLAALVRHLSPVCQHTVPCPQPVPTPVLRKILIPEQYWSGCPPNHH